MFKEKIPVNVLLNISERKYEIKTSVDCLKCEKHLIQEFIGKCVFCGSYICEECKKCSKLCEGYLKKEKQLEKEKEDKEKLLKKEEEKEKRKKEYYEKKQFEDLGNVKLNISEDDREKVKAISKEHKFDFKGNELAYPKDNSEKLNYFIKSYRFFENLINIGNLDEELNKKLKLYFNQFNDIYKEAKNWNIEVSKDINFGKDKLNNKVNKFFLDNEKKIFDMIDETFSFARVTKTFDPDEFQGVA